MKMNMEEESNYNYKFQSDSKYIKKGKAKLTRGFLFSLFLNKIIQFLLFLIISCGLAYGGYLFFINQEYKTVNNEVVMIDKKAELKEGDKIAFTEQNIEFYSTPLIKLDFDKLYTGKIIGMPFSIVTVDNKNIQLPDDTYMVEFPDGFKAQLNKLQILGKVKK